MTNQQTSLDLRMAAMHVASLPEVQQMIDDYFTDRDVDADSMDVYRALREAADRLETEK